MSPVLRFAPTASGRAHPGTLLAALLVWLEARHRGARCVLRIEDIDVERVRQDFRGGLVDDFAWFGLAWDAVEHQHGNRARHEAALDRLAGAGLLYPCSCTRARLRDAPLALDGGRVYPGHCRQRILAGDWRNCTEALRLRLPAEQVEIQDLSGRVFACQPSCALGEPVLRRRDGALAYHLAAVVDDAALGADPIVRGDDLAWCTPLQVQMQRILGLATPRYRHHFLLCEERGGKFAKLHGAVAAETLSQHYDAAALCGLLAQVAGLQDEPRPCRPGDLLADFAWARLRTRHQVLRWTGTELQWLGDAD